MTQVATHSLLDRVKELISSGEFQLPPVPELAVRLRTTLEDDSVNVQQIVELIRGEPAVVAALLRSANCVALGFRATSDVSRAISRLGLKHVESIVTAVLVQGQFQANVESNRRLLAALWTHAISSAAVARHLAKREGYSLEDAFLGGLLHGVGRLLVLRALDRLAEVDRSVAPPPAAVEELVETLQFELGYATLWSWNFSKDICEASRAMDSGVDDPTRTIVRIVRAADLVTQKLGLHPHPDPDVDLLENEAFSSFGIGEDEVDELLVAIESEIDEVRSAFTSA